MGARWEVWERVQSGHPPVFPRNGTGDGGRDARRSSTVRTSADMPLGGISTHVLRCGRVRGELYTRVDRSRAAACDLRCYLRSNKEEGCAFENERRLARQERVPFQSGGSNKSIERGQLFLEYVGVNREIDRENGIFEKCCNEIDTLPAGPIASRHTGHARPTSLVFPPFGDVLNKLDNPPSVVCSKSGWISVKGATSRRDASVYERPASVHVASTRRPLVSALFRSTQRSASVSDAARDRRAHVANSCAKNSRREFPTSTPHQVRVRARVDDSPSAPEVSRSYPSNPDASPSRAIGSRTETR